MFYDLPKYNMACKVKSAAYIYECCVIPLIGRDKRVVIGNRSIRNSLMG
jgi:hypothetical protein